MSFVVGEGGCVMTDMQNLRQRMALYSQKIELVTDIWEGILGFCFLAVGIWAFFAAGLFVHWNRWTRKWHEPTEIGTRIDKLISVIIMLIGLRLLYKAFFV